MRRINLQKTAIKIRDFIAKCVSDAHSDGVVIGISGGVDSAVAAALAVDALGAARVHGMLLPCESCEADLVDATTVVKHLGIYREVVDLTKTFETMVLSFENMQHKLARANLKSRLRMCALYARANQRSYLVCGTTNLPESYVGYFTKYGDGGVDIEPLMCLTKGEVRAMAALKRFPPEIVGRPASAGLWKGQVSEEEIGIPYDRIDEAVLSFSDPSIKAFDDDRKVIARMFDRSAHKRCMPPALTCPVVEE